MFFPRSTIVHVARAAADMRKGHDGLFALVRQLDLDPFSGHLFLFLNRRRNRAKLLFLTRGGFSLLYKRLEKNRFFLPDFPTDVDQVKISNSDLALLLEGFDPFSAPSFQAWEPPAA